MNSTKSTTTSAPQNAPVQFLTVKQAAERLAVSTQTVRNLIWRNEIAGVKVGKRGWRIPASALKQLQDEAEAGQRLRPRDNGNE